MRPGAINFHDNLHLILFFWVVVILAFIYVMLCQWKYSNRAWLKNLQYCPCRFNLHISKRHNSKSDSDSDKQEKMFRHFLAQPGLTGVNRSSFVNLEKTSDFKVIDTYTFSLPKSETGGNAYLWQSSIKHTSQSISRSDYNLHTWHITVSYFHILSSFNRSE